MSDGAGVSAERFCSACGVEVGGVAGVASPAGPMPPPPVAMAPTGTAPPPMDAASTSVGKVVGIVVAVVVVLLVVLVLSIIAIRTLGNSAEEKFSRVGTEINAPLSVDGVVDVPDGITLEG